MTRVLYEGKEYVLVRTQAPGRPDQAELVDPATGVPCWVGVGSYRVLGSTNPPVIQGLQPFLARPPEFLAQFRARRLAYIVEKIRAGRKAKALDKAPAKPRVKAKAKQTADIMAQLKLKFTGAPA